MHTHQGELVRSRNGFIRDCRLLPNARLVVRGLAISSGLCSVERWPTSTIQTLVSREKGPVSNETGPFSTRSS